MMLSGTARDEDAAALTVDVGTDVEKTGVDVASVILAEIDEAGSGADVG